MLLFNVSGWFTLPNSFLWIDLEFPKELKVVVCQDNVR
jgi:hypothetical protein